LVFAIFRAGLEEQTDNARPERRVLKTAKGPTCHEIAALDGKIIFCAAVVVCMLWLQRDATSAAIRGTVRNAQSGRQLADVMVEVEGTQRSVFSDSSGTFFFDSVTSGSYNLLFYHEVMEPLRLNDVFVSGGSTKRLEVEMNPRLRSLDTITVLGSTFRKAPDVAASTKTMTFDEILRSPGALVDIQRAVQNLPSVSSAGDNTNEIIVRGGNRGENLVVMDNIELPNPNHFADQGSGGGVISLINPLLVKGLTFCAGSPPAQYGLKASSVLDVKLREGNDRIVIGGVDVGMAGAGIHLEGPLWANATFMASATKSYLDFFASMAKTTAIPSYWGGQAKVAQSLGIHRLSLNLIYGSNGISIADGAEDAGAEGDHVESGGIIYASGVNWDAQLSDRISMVTTLSAAGNSFDRLDYSDTVSDGSDLRDTFYVNTSFEREQTLKTVFSLDMGEKNRLSAGVSAKRCDFDESSRENIDSVETSLRGLGYRYGGFLSAILYPVERFKIIPGLRCDHFTFNRSTTVAPRLGMVFSLRPHIELTASGGLQYQEPDYAQLCADELNRSLRARRVATGMCGVEYSLERLSARLIAEAFYKRLDFAPVPYEFVTADPFDRSDRVLSTGTGSSYGIELFAHKKLTRHFSGSAAYSWSRSWQDDFRPGHEGEQLRGEYDFRNMVTLTAGYKFELVDKAWYARIHDRWWMVVCSPVLPIADRVEVSAKWRYLGGRPRTLKTYDSARKTWIDGDYLGSGFPAYHRLDIRFERRYGFGFLQMIYYFDFQNIYNRKNIWTYMYSDRRGSETPIYQFSFFPAGGVIIGF